MIRSKIFGLLIFVLACQPKEQNIISLHSPAGVNSAEPHLFTDAAGDVFLSWVEKGDSMNTLQYSKLTGSEWSAPAPIASGKNWFVNWADYPMLSVNNGKFISHFLDKSGEGTFAYDVKLSTSSDGKAWSTPTILHDDGKQAEHGFVSLLPFGDNFLVVWLDGRNTVMEGMENMDHHEGHHGSMSLRAAVINPTGAKLKEWELDNKTCDCCQTTAVLTAAGPVVIYRDRSDEEIRDMSIVRLVNDAWTQPEPINADQWKIAGCPVNGPRADASGNNLVVAWFTASENQPKVNVAFSSNNGESFSKPVLVNKEQTIGRVDVILVDENNAIVSWMEGAAINAMRISKDGTTGRPVQIAKTSEARSSGFPQMTRTGDEIVFAWTDVEAKTISTAQLKLHIF